MAKKQRKIRVVGERRSKPDLKRLSKVLVELAQAQAETAAAAEHRRAQGPPRKQSGDAA